MLRKGEDPVDWAYAVGEMPEDVYRIVRPNGTATRSVAASARADAKFGASDKGSKAVAASATPQTQAPALPAGRVAAATERDLTGLYARNPLVAQVQAERQVYASSLEASGGATPTLFRAGDTPAFTASGVDPNLLLSIPWTARHAAAAEPSRARVLEMFEELSGPDGPVLASEYQSHQGNQEYTSRVMAWQSAGWDLAREQDTERHAQVAAAQQEHVKAALGDPQEWSDEQCYESVFGDVDRRAEQRRIENLQAIVEGRAWGHGQDVAKVRASLEERIAASGSRTPSNTSTSIDYSKILDGGA
jgi:hypothetical protein